MAKKQEEPASLLPAPPRAGSATLSAVDEIISGAMATLKAERDKAQLFIEEANAQLSRLEQIISGGIPSYKRSIESLPYIGWQVSDAIFHVLKERGEPMFPDEIIRIVLERGVFLGKGLTAKGEPEAQVRKSFAYHLMSKEDKKKSYGKRVKVHEPMLKRHPDGKIGKSEWK